MARIIGKDTADRLIGTAGNDIIAGLGGNDVIETGGGSDSVSGGAGEDTIAAWGAMQDRLSIDAGEDDDRVILGAGTVARVLGGAGTDTLVIGDVAMHSFSAAKAGFERFGTTGLGRVLGTEGRDSVDFSGMILAEGAGGLRLDFSGGPMGAAGDSIRATGLADTITGSNGHDRIYGEDGADVIEAGLGDDGVDGGAGNDRLLGGAGNDRLLGRDGEDTLEGGEGDDILYGGEGDDTLHGDIGANRLYGEAGDDLIRSIGAGDTVSGGDGDDTVVLAGNSVGPSSLQGGAGQDTLVIANDVHLSGLSARASGFEWLAVQSSFSGTETGNAIDLSGFALKDTVGVTLSGLRGNDHLIGTAGADNLYGGADDDTLEGGDGQDLIDGSEGTDIASYARAAAGVHVDLALADLFQDTGGAGFDRLIRIEGLEGSAHADLLKGTAADESFTGNAGGDVIEAGRGADLLLGGSGDDVLRGGLGVDRIEGGSGNDTIYAGGRHESFGSDTPPLPGAPIAGPEWLDGGSGADTYVFETADDLGSWTYTNVTEMPGDPGGHGGVDLEVSLYGTGITNHIAFSAAESDAISILPGLSGFAFHGRADYTGLNGAMKGGFAYTVLADRTEIHLDMLGEGFGDTILQLNSRVDLMETSPGSHLLVGLAIREGTAEADTLKGTGTSDSLYGNAGADSLAGGAGQDWLDGGEGNDRLSGGAGADRFTFAAGHGRDTVTDFSSTGGDIIALNGFGPALDSFEEAQASMVQVGTRVVLSTTDGGAITFEHVQLADLTAGDFAFG